MDFLNFLSWGDTGWGDDFFFALCITLVLSIFAFALGTVIGIWVAMIKVKAGSFGRRCANIYTTVFRGVPEILFIYLLFFGGSGMLMSVAGITGYTDYLELPPFAIGVIAIGAISGAYSTEVFRGAILSIEKGQQESGLALGLPESDVFKKIILPQAFKNSIPALGNVWQLTLKDTALVSVAGLFEIMYVSRTASNYEKEPFFFFIFAALLFLMLTVCSSYLQRRIEAIYNKSTNRG